MEAKVPALGDLGSSIMHDVLQAGGEMVDKNGWGREDGAGYGAIPPVSSAL
jgi:hypothetical protein